MSALRFALCALRFAAAQALCEILWLLTVSATWRRFLGSACHGPQAVDSTIVTLATLATLATLGARLEFAALFGLNHENVLP